MENISAILKTDRWMVMDNLYGTIRECIGVDLKMVNSTVKVKFFIIMDKLLKDIGKMEKTLKSKIFKDETIQDDASFKNI